MVQYHDLHTCLFLNIQIFIDQTCLIFYYENSFYIMSEVFDNDKLSSEIEKYLQSIIKIL